VRSPLLRTLPAASFRPVVQPKVQPLAIRWPPAPTWRAELLQEPVRVKVAPVAFMSPLTTTPYVPTLRSSEPTTTAPLVTFRAAPAWTVRVPTEAAKT